LQINNTILLPPTDQLGGVAQPANRKRVTNKGVSRDLFMQKLRLKNIQSADNPILPPAQVQQ
jgi:hypothetical protein